PGTSRSGATLTAGLMLGFRREDAARFSFLLYVPVGFAALLHDMKDLVEVGFGGADALPLAVGFVTSAVSAYLVIDWLIEWLQTRRLRLFVAYRVLLGLVILGLPFVV
ncbi:MAG: undecaprenyl-diphosphate phosphatase, partial [Acidobacteriota bacterium]